MIDNHIIIIIIIENSMYEVQLYGFYIVSAVPKATVCDLHSTCSVLRSCGFLNIFFFNSNLKCSFICFDFDIEAQFDGALKNTIETFSPQNFDINNIKIESLANQYIEKVTKCKRNAFSII